MRQHSVVTKKPTIWIFSFEKPCSLHTATYYLQIKYN